MDQDNSCINFSQVDDVYCRFCWIDITNYMAFVGELIFMTIIHFSDIAFDIYMLIYIHNHDARTFYSEIFYISLGILLLSFLSASIPTEGKTNCGIIIDFLLGFFQIKFLINVYQSFTTGEFKESLIRLRLDEALLESTFQSLLQLYILIQFKRYEDDVTQYDIIMSYVSFTLSLVSVAYTMISYEIETFNNLYLIKGKKEESVFTNSYGTNELSIFSSYGICLSFYRITEVFSRVGLLVYSSYITKWNNFFNEYKLYGYHIIFLIVIDFFMANFFEIISYLRINCFYLCKNDENDNSTENSNSSESIYTFLKDFVSLLSKIFYKIKYTVVYYEPFSLEYVEKDCENLEGNNEEIELIIIEDDMSTRGTQDYLCVPFKSMHFISKFISNTIIIGYLIDYSFFEEEYSYVDEKEVKIISILFTITFFISNALLYFIWLWNSQREKYTEKFKAW
tara:strand:+ start:196 stop:1551 length:1356 start_codon:yes stop_codon:yes gene_type:complete